MTRHLQDGNPAEAVAARSDPSRRGKVGEVYNSDYAVTVEFYDLLQAESDRRRAERRFTEAARRARHAIVDVGAGTGIVTEVLLAVSAAPVHAVEPAPAMRAALLMRVARLEADQRARLTLHCEPIEEFRLEAVADLAIASNIIACLSPATRRAAWQAISRVLLPGGLLLFDPPPARLPTRRDTVGRLGPVRIGPDLYTAVVTREPDRGIVRTVFTYQVERNGRILRQAQESFAMWPASSFRLGTELEAAGLQVVQAPTAQLMAARRPAH
ncbi:methyltransferase domain-containing protein [Streptomyces broussonetiae]|uniref:Methyltransferase domain-containing protein n=1 Tax=Streptomyces broussonetiae TaxID=2686304 RepID=A0A6I6N5A6_9ACTN|nr:class I SAM-dependent methyltransferase [Streptomyces broussonetiae]QHA08298.1 methyltransferase domain-containing protein [Streptomyces broussonetiae]